VAGAVDLDGEARLNTLSRVTARLAGSAQPGLQPILGDEATIPAEVVAVLRRAGHPALQTDQFRFSTVQGRQSLAANGLPARCSACSTQELWTDGLIPGLLTVLRAKALPITIIERM
jgi:hypothetical protein